MYYFTNRNRNIPNQNTSVRFSDGVLYDEITAHNEIEIFPQTTKCIN